MRLWVVDLVIVFLIRVFLVFLAVACGKAAPHHPDDAPAVVGPRPIVIVDAGGQPPQPLPPDTYADLGTTLLAVIPADARVVGFGELHSRTDRVAVTSTLTHFTNDALPAIGDKLSDLVVETWVVDPKCGKAAADASTKVTTTMKRPEATKSEIAVLGEAARAAGIQPHAMHLTCADYAVVAPPGKDVDTAAMLTLTTRELGRIATEAVAHRDAEPKHRPWIALYGGALHNDRFPDKAVVDWSYAAKVDGATHDHFVEIDLIVPELAEADPVLQNQPWFDTVKIADTHFHVWKRGERSFVVVLPRAPK